MFSQNAHHAIFSHACKIAGKYWNSNCAGFATDPAVAAKSVSANPTMEHTPGQYGVSVAGLVGIILGSIIVGVVLAVSTMFLIKCQMNKSKNGKLQESKPLMPVMVEYTSMSIVAFGEVDLQAATQLPC